MRSAAQIHLAEVNSGDVYISNATLNGEVLALRACITDHRTPKEEDLDTLIDSPAAACF